ncbi:hypothetical protein M413DRAFT_438687 [Hebeloma cylindrosporum]|uniref:Uncharacterized protein n=1 Tax=Hebeloma cylindrosporum TaxID=76867 RepID=A0A0C3CLC3_HEBCY|nr:hypothetical protein M413DRAFT_438687 [Hebeloma cylindrosporum h7]
MDLGRTLQASKEPDTGVGSKGRLEGQRLKHRQSFVNVPKSRVAEKVRNPSKIAIVSPGT